jgi:hypothetical protein
MIKFTTAAIAASLIFAAPAFAADEHHPENSEAAQSSAAVPDAAATVRKMQGNVRKMQAQLERMAKAKTDEQRQTIMLEHMKTMHENMDLAHSMEGGDMACDMMRGGKMGGHMDMMHKGGMGGMGMMGGEGRAEASPDRMQQLEKRLDMMQMMMEQMMRHQEGAPAPMK